MGTTEGGLTADSLAGRTGALRAALDWWALAGVDTLVSALPRSWLEPTAAPEPPDRALARATAPAALARATPEVGADYARFETLSELHAHVRDRWPGAPLFDGVAATGILVVGEAPSATDLETGRPFTGPAGALLDRMLGAIGLGRQSCGITLVAPLRPAPGPPRPEDIEADLALTRAHLRLLAPRAILLLGATATRVLTGATAPISAVRGRPLEVAAGERAVPAVATFNPAYLLRRPEDKALAWADLLAFRALLAGTVRA
jgi:DNA polymerase